MNAQSFGHVFGVLFKRIEQRLAFIPRKLRKVVLVGLAIVGWPIFLVAFLAFRTWLYRDIPLELAPSLDDTDDDSGLDELLELRHESDDIEETDKLFDCYNGFQPSGPEGPGYYENGYRMDN
mgnify:CR=1 FL=1